VQQTNAMKKVIESRGENNNCNDEFSQWCCKHLATLNKNTIDSEFYLSLINIKENTNLLLNNFLLNIHCFSTNVCDIFERC